MKTATLILSAALVATTGTPLALRHDIDEEKYVEFGAGFPAVGQVSGLGSGTLIAPDWVLTAAHVPEMISRFRRGAPLTVSLGGNEYKVVQVVFPEERASEPDRHDIALLELDEPVPDDITPLTIFEEDVAPGTEFVLAGWGILARGDEGVPLSPESMAAPTRRLRAGKNVIERVDPVTALFFARFDDPDTGLDLEAAPSIGDSGGPALVRVEGRGDAAPEWQVAGVMAQADDADEDRVISEYGEEFGMTLVVAYLDWIQATIEK